MTLPLEGYTVLALEQAVAAPLATRQLADLGARVVKVERPGTGDFARGYDETVHGQSSYFVWLNRSKESITVDIKTPEGTGLLHRLLESADVFVQNLLPGATARLGLDAVTLAEAFPRLVVCDISGYGDTGPYRDAKAYDLLIQCEAAVLAVTGTEEAPAKVGIAVADIAAGMYAYSGILSALLHRERTGEARPVAVSMLEAMGEWMGQPLLYTTYGGSPPPRSGAAHASIAPYGPFRTADGTVQLAVQNEREWQRFCTDVLGAPEVSDDERFATNSRRVTHLAELVDLIESRFRSLSSAEVIRLLDSAGIATATVNDVAGLAAHPQLAARHRWREVGTPAGPVRVLVPPAVPGGAEPRMDPVPALGGSTHAILAELGCTAEEIAGLRERGVI